MSNFGHQNNYTLHTPRFILSNALQCHTPLLFYRQYRSVVSTLCFFKRPISTNDDESIFQLLYLYFQNHTFGCFNCCAELRYKINDHVNRNVCTVCELLVMNFQNNTAFMVALETRQKRKLSIMSIVSLCPNFNKLATFQVLAPEIKIKTNI